MRWKTGILIAIISGIVGFLLRGYLSLGSLEPPLINGIWLVLSFLVGLIGGSDILGIIRDYLKERKEIKEQELDKEKIYNSLYNKTKQCRAPTPRTPFDCRWKSTIEIASFNNLTVERVRYICSIHKKIKLMTQEDIYFTIKVGDGEKEIAEKQILKEEKWAIREFVE